MNFSPSSQLGLLILGEAALADVESTSFKDTFEFRDSVSVNSLLTGVTVSDTLNLWNVNAGASSFTSVLGDITLGITYLGAYETPGAAEIATTSTAVSFSGTVSDALSLSDSLRLFWGGRTTDTLSLSDSVAYDFLAPSTPLSVTIVDKIIRNGSITGNNLALRDGISVVLLPGGPIQIAVSSLDAFNDDSLLLNYGLLVNDTINAWSDVFVKSTGSVPEAFDSMFYNNFDAISIGFGTNLTFSDTLNNWSDTRSTQNNVSQENVDSFFLTDSITLNLLGINAYSDTLVITDEVALRLGYLKSFSDSLNNWNQLFLNGVLTTQGDNELEDDLNNWMDSVLAVTNTSDTVYLRQCLNDVVN